jgi:cytochrome c biogenesis protein CcmG/thiol:disulfide interchange protein DsbE
MRALKFLLPVALFAVVSVALYAGLSLDPKKIPSVLIDKPVPEFNLPPVQGRDLGLASADLKVGEVSLVNVFASWCVACRAEHPLLMELSKSGTVPVHGLNYKDKPEQAKGWLERFGDPYVRTGADINGRVGIDFGVYGVPETFIIDKAGRIAYKHIGPIRAEDLEETILPLVKQLREKG